jgi:hypothetical protein
MLLSHGTVMQLGSMWSDIIAVIHRARRTYAFLFREFFLGAQCTSSGKSGLQDESGNEEREDSEATCWKARRKVRGLIPDEDPPVRIQRRLIIRYAVDESFVWEQRVKKDER